MRAVLHHSPSIRWIPRVSNECILGSAAKNYFGVRMQGEQVKRFKNLRIAAHRNVEILELTSPEPEEGIERHVACQSLSAFLESGRGKAVDADGGPRRRRDAAIDAPRTGQRGLSTRQARRPRMRDASIANMAVRHGRQVFEGCCIRVPHTEQVTANLTSVGRRLGSACSRNKARSHTYGSSDVQTSVARQRAQARGCTTRGAAMVELPRVTIARYIVHRYAWPPRA